MSKKADEIAEAKIVICLKHRIINSIVRTHLGILPKKNEKKSCIQYVKKQIDDKNNALQIFTVKIKRIVVPSF